MSFNSSFYTKRGCLACMLTREERALISGGSLPSTPISSHLNPTLNTIWAKGWEGKLVPTEERGDFRFQKSSAIRNCSNNSPSSASLTLATVGLPKQDWPCEVHHWPHHPPLKPKREQPPYLPLAATLHTNQPLIPPLSPPPSLSALIIKQNKLSPIFQQVLNVCHIHHWLLLASPETKRMYIIFYLYLIVICIWL